MKHSDFLSLLKRFYVYQEERFPIIFLILATFPVILSSHAIIAGANLSFLNVFLLLLASISYFFHIRVIDEHRDFKHDSLYHNDRPVQKEIISLIELKKIDFIAIVLFLIISVFTSFYALLLALIMLVYTFFGSREFFLGRKIRRHFFLYNAVNLVQMLLLQIFVYSFFFVNFYLNDVILIHFLFVSIGTMMFEFLRKIKTPQLESTGKDTYTWYFGFNKSLFIYFFLVCLNVVLFLCITVKMQLKLGIWTFLPVALSLFFFLSLYLHFTKKNSKTDKLLQVSSLFLYMAFNLLIYFL